MDRKQKFTWEPGDVVFDPPDEDGENLEEENENVTQEPRRENVRRELPVPVPQGDK